MNGKPITKEEIGQMTELRSHGFSVPEIAHTIKRGKSTVLRYIANITVLPQYKSVLEAKQKTSKTRSVAAWNLAMEQAKNFVSNFDKRSRILIATMLYWGEGAKRDFSFMNSDPNMVRVFVSCLRELGITKENITISIRIYEGMSKRNVVHFWTKLLTINFDQVVAVHVIRGKKKGKLKYGMCRVRVVRGGLYLKLIQSIIALLPKAILTPP